MRTDTQAWKNSLKSAGVKLLRARSPSDMQCESTDGICVQ